MSAPRPRKRNVLGAGERAFLEQLWAAFPGARRVDDHAPGPDTIEIDLRPLHLILRPSALESELDTWGALDYRCPSCGEHFVAASLFDAHRVSVPDLAGGRRCLDEEELSRGGLVKNRRGIWGRRSDDRSTSDMRKRPITTPNPEAIEPGTAEPQTSNDLDAAVLPADVGVRHASGDS